MRKFEAEVVMDPGTSALIGLFALAGPLALVGVASGLVYEAVSRRF